MMKEQGKSTEEKLLIILVGILIILVLVLIGGGVFVYLQFQGSNSNSDLPETVSVDNSVPERNHDQQQFPRTEVNVYFISPVDFKLVAEPRLALQPPGLGDRVQRAVEFLIEGPDSEDLVGVAPAQSTVLAVFYNPDEKRIYLDMSASFYRNLPGHTLVEWAAIYSVVNTVCGISEEIESMVFLEESMPVRQSPGNWDWNRPYTPEVAWVRYFTDAEAYSEQ